MKHHAGTGFLWLLTHAPLTLALLGGWVGGCLLVAKILRYRMGT